MAEDSGGQEKSEEPTSRRLSESRRKGDVAKSVEFPSAAVLLTSLLTIYVLRDYMLEQCIAILRFYLGSLNSATMLSANMTGVMYNCFILAIMVAGPLMAAVFIVAIIANVGQFGFIFTTEKIMPDFSKLNPIQGFTRLFSQQMLANVLKSIFKVIIISYVAYHEVMKVIDQLNPLMQQEPYQIFAFIADVSFWIILKSALILFILAAADFAFQRWHYMKSMRMTKQEVKEEAKQTEGDPHVKGRIRSIQMEMARRRMMAEVPKADVVITNPTHLAVALVYDNLSMTAPKVVAKGAGVIARRIREVAQEHGVPLIEDKPLAQALYKEVDINGSIPENLYQAVAEILAYLYGLRRKSA